MAVVYEGVEAEVSEGHALEMLDLGRTRRAEDDAGGVDASLAQLRLQPEHRGLGVLVQPQNAVVHPAQDVDPDAEQLLCDAAQPAEVTEDELVLGQLVLLARG